MVESEGITFQHRNASHEVSHLDAKGLSIQYTESATVLVVRSLGEFARGFVEFAVIDHVDVSITTQTWTHPQRFNLMPSTPLHTGSILSHPSYLSIFVIRPTSHGQKLVLDCRPRTSPGLLCTTVLPRVPTCANVHRSAAIMSNQESLTKAVAGRRVLQGPQNHSSPVSLVLPRDVDHKLGLLASFCSLAVHP